MSDERRRAPRYPVDIPARLELLGRTHEVRVRDLCRDALFAELAGEWSVDTPVHLSADLPGADSPLEIEGRIVRVAGPGDEYQGVAVLFTQLSPSVATRIDLLLASLEG